MGDILGGVFGTRENTNQNVQVDPTTQQLNALRLQQAQELFANSGLGMFAGPGGDAYKPSPQVAQLFDYVMSAANTQPGMSFEDYKNLGLDQSTFREGLQRSDNQFTESKSDNQGFMDLTKSDLANAIGQAGASNANVYNQLRGANSADYAGMFGVNQNVFNQMYNRGIDSTSNYVNQIATPAIMQQMALAGLDSSGAMPAAIAKASAESGLPLFQSLMANYQSQQGALGQQYMGNQAQAGQTYQGATASLGQLNAQQLADINKYFGGLDATLNQNKMAADQAAFTGQANRDTQFISTLPGAQSEISSLPYRNATMAGQIATNLFPMADYERQLQEQDLLRRQGLATTAFTGLPYTPATSTTQQRNTPSWFNPSSMFGNMFG